ncbi:MAG: hypothetical protein IPK39_09885 [Sulfuritalea sp.]|nr:hypothetical protein [Sulfuritalea sp.]
MSFSSGSFDQIAPSVALGQRLDHMGVSLERIRRLDVRNSDFAHDCNSFALSANATNWRKYTGLMGRYAGAQTSFSMPGYENGAKRSFSEG